MTDTKLTHKDYLKIALPFILSTMTQPLLGAVDTAVVGRLGASELIGGVAVGTVIMNTLYWLFGFFRVSTTGQSAIALGKRCEKQQAASLIRPFMLASGVGLLFILCQNVIWNAAQWLIAPDPHVTAQARHYFFILIWGAPFVLLNYTLIGWLMGQAKVKETLFTQIVGNVLNIILDIVFVIYLEMGVAGVASATLIAQVTTFIIGLRLVNRAAGFSFRPYLPLAKMGGQEIKTILSSNTDLLLRTVCILIMFNCMARFGSALGGDTLATNAVLMQITFLVSYIFDGIANASSVFAGKSVGEKSPALLGQVLKLNLLWSGAGIILITVIILLARHSLVLLFTAIPEVVAQYHKVSLWLILFPVVAGFGLTLYGVFTGTGTTRPIRNSTFLALIMFLLTLMTTQPDMGNQGLWLAFCLFYVGRCIFLLPFIKQVKDKCIPDDHPDADPAGIKQATHEQG